MGLLSAALDTRAIILADVIALFVFGVYAWLQLRAAPGETGPIPRPTPIQAAVVIAGLALFVFAGRCG
jgi:hypothetical protein